jgi:hypothetical protein
VNSTVSSVANLIHGFQVDYAPPVLELRFYEPSLIATRGERRAEGCDVPTERSRSTEGAKCDGQRPEREKPPGFEQELDHRQVGRRACPPSHLSGAPSHGPPRRSSHDTVHKEIDKASIPPEMNQ